MAPTSNDNSQNQGRHFATKKETVFSQPVQNKQPVSGTPDGQPWYKHWYTLVFTLMFILGVVIFMYPIVSNMYNNQVQYDVIKDFSQQANSYDKEYIDHQIELCNNYNALLATGRTNFPRDFYKDASKVIDSIAEDDMPDVMSYNTVMGFVEIPAVKVELPIYCGVDDLTLTEGAAYMPSTSIPVGGPSTHSAITGHRGLPSADMFRHLDKLKEGDIFYVNIYNMKLAYQVDQIKTVKPDDISDLAIEPGKDYSTLITCDPYMINSERMLVRGERVPLEDAPEPEQRMNFVEKHATDFTAVIVAFIAFGAFLAIMIYYDRRKRGNKSK